MNNGFPTASFRAFDYPRGQSALHCGSVSLDSLAVKFGTPLYVYSADQILNRYSLFSKAFAHRDHQICYSVKANSSLAILKLLAHQGSGFDIVSGGELERVLRVSRTAVRRVVFSGVGKTVPEIDLALKAGILIFNVESESEAALLADRAAKLQIRARIALRVNPDVFADTHPYISTGLRDHKFGIDIRASRSVYREVKRSRFLDPVGVSLHIGSQIRAAAPFGAALARAAELVRELQSDGIEIRYVDAGGGLGIDYHGGSKPETDQDPKEMKREDPDSPSDPAVSIRQYAAAIERALKGLDVCLLLEPGRFVVAQAGALLARILYIKRNGEKIFIITDAGMNDLIRPALYQAYHEVVPVLRNLRAKRNIVDIVGPVCESGDFFARDREMPMLKEGDLVAILDAGAYGMSLSSNYNSRPRPAEILIEGKKARVIRRRETTRDLLRNEIGID